MGKLDGKVALITGGARGQGEAEARLFVELGARVAVADILEDEGRAVAADLGDEAMFVPLDVTSEAAWEKAVGSVTERFGGLQVLINNAGIVSFAPLLGTTLEDYRRVIDVNQVGVFLGMRAAAPAMRAGGSIINISSIDGLVGMPFLTAYVASKFAVRGMTKCAAIELAGLGIRVNSIHPGAVDTPMVADMLGAAGALDMFLPKIPLGRLAESADVAHLAAFLASDESSYCTGSEFVVDGGLTAGITLP
ncbi:MAG: glucose 1-dehydrogenase [Acidimicrobiia bacterium]